MINRVREYKCQIRWEALLIALSLICAVALPTSDPAVAAPKKLATAKPGNCAACHSGEKVLPPGHEDTRNMTFKQCKECHHKAGSETLFGKMPLGHIHQLAGTTCIKCHGKTKAREMVEMVKCVDCHGSSDKLAERTANVKPANPHTSPHYGTGLDCNVCHHQHTKSENYCSQCHKFDFMVP